MYRSLFNGTGSSPVIECAGIVEQVQATATPTATKTSASPTKTASSTPISTKTSASPTTAIPTRPHNRRGQGHAALQHHRQPGLVAPAQRCDASPGAAAVFIAPVGDSASKVSFYLDDTSAAKPAFRVETDKPYDFSAPATATPGCIRSPGWPRASTRSRP